MMRQPRLENPISIPIKLSDISALKESVDGRLAIMYIDELSRHLNTIMLENSRLKANNERLKTHRKNLRARIKQIEAHFSAAMELIKGGTLELEEDHAEH